MANGKSGDKGLRAIVIGMIVFVITVTGIFIYFDKQPSTNAAAPASISKTDGSGLVFNPELTNQIDIWEDFQCPACRSFEAINNEYIKKIFDKLELNVNLIKKTSRVKTRDNISDENNPILIELNDIDSKNKIMKNANKLKGFKLGLEKFIFLNNDLTFPEGSCEKHLRDEQNTING